MTIAIEPSLAELKLDRLLTLRRLHELRAERDRLERLNRPRRWASPLDMACALDRTMVRTPALEVINAALVDLADGRIPGNKLAVFVSPQEGKSTLCSYWNPAWLLSEVDPDLRIIDVSYSDEMARRWGAEVKRLFESYNGDEGTTDLGVRLRVDSRAAGRWQIERRRGGIYCAGFGGSISGKPAEYICVDDPLKNMEEAQSTAHRDRIMRTWQSVLVPRMGPNTKVVWIQTLWHEAEPIRQILAEHANDWRVIRIPAIADSPDDPLGRRVGEPMVSARGHRDWAKIKATVGPYVFSALYQQSPAPAEGGLFKRIWWRYYTLFGDWLTLGAKTYRLADCWRYATIDLANSTRTAADFTVISAWARTISGDLLLLDTAEVKVGEQGHFDHARPLIERWRLDTVFVEGSQYGTSLVRDAANNGISITAVQAEKDKFTRALPYSAWAAAGRVWLRAGALWLDDWINQHASFPAARHDDKVDTGSLAVRVGITRNAPAPAAPPKPPPPPPDYGLGGHVDIGTADF